MKRIKNNTDLYKMLNIRRTAYQQRKGKTDLIFFRFCLRNNPSFTFFFPASLKVLDASQEIRL